MPESELLVCEISGKRPGDCRNRPTEKFSISYPKVIISNNSENYVTDWPIVNVPEDYRSWYIENLKNSENAWYAPMNRSYAIHYAKGHGYRYVAQLDDNIKGLDLSYKLEDEQGIRRYRAYSATEMMDDCLTFLVQCLKQTNAGMAGCSMGGCGAQCETFLAERFVYSLFVLDTQRVPEVFHGDFEDDIEFRLKLHQMGVPSIQVTPFRYSKTGQKTSKDESGCRAAYTAAGVKRGEHMRKMYGNIYSCGLSRFSHSVGTAASDTGELFFKHRLIPFKDGLLVNDMAALHREFAMLLQKWATHRPDKVTIKTVKRK